MKQKRVLFLFITIGFVAGLGLLLMHRSENPVILGRYSLNLVFLAAVLVSFYGVAAYVYRYGWERFGQAYLFVAANVLSFILFLTALNIAAVVANFFLRSDLASGGTYTVEAAQQERTHAELLGLSQEEFHAFRREQGRPRNFQYEPWVGFKETPGEGRYINVSPEGFRRTAGTPDAPRHWIFLLGGSTTFGYGVSDEQTIASYLQTRLTERYGENTFGVRNFGRAYYYSSQEFLLLWSLLERGLRPSVVVFIDGINEPQTSPYYVAEMREMFYRYQDESQGRASVGELLAELTVQTPLHPYVRQLFQSMTRATAPTGHPLERLEPSTTATDIVSQYEANNETIRLLAARYNVEPFFVVQPMPGYKNQYATHVFMAEPPSRLNYEVLELLDAAAVLHPNRISLTGLLAGYQKQPFVDRLHYSPAVHKLIGEAIADHIGSALEGLARSR